MALFYEMRGSDNTVLKRDGGFATQDAAKTAGREDAKKMKNSRHSVQVCQPDKPDLGALMVRQDCEESTR